MQILCLLKDHTSCVFKCPMQKTVSIQIRRGWSPVAGEDNKNSRRHKVKKGIEDRPASVTPGTQKSEFHIFGHSVEKNLLLQVLALSSTEHGWLASLCGSRTSTRSPWPPTPITSPSFLGFYTDSSSSAHHWNSGSSGPSPSSGLTSFSLHILGGWGYRLLHGFSSLSAELSTLRPTCISNPHLSPDLQTQKFGCLPDTPFICPWAPPYVCVADGIPFHQVKPETRVIAMAFLSFLSIILLYLSPIDSSCRFLYDSCDCLNPNHQDFSPNYDKGHLLFVLCHCCPP